MLGCVRKLAAFVAAISLLSASGAAVAAQASRPAEQMPVAKAQARIADPWLTLSTMTASSSSTTAMATSQGEAVPVSWPHIVPLSVVLGTIATAIYILLDDGNDNHNGTGGIAPALRLRPTPLSPA